MYLDIARGSLPCIKSKFNLQYITIDNLFNARILCCPAKHKRLPENMGKKKDRQRSLSFSHLCKKVQCFTARLSTLYLHGISEIWQPE